MKSLNNLYESALKLEAIMKEIHQRAEIMRMEAAKKVA
ncbi:hypothetical protein Xbud_01860 [Xenorhabdus budapestensis]|uniref:Uncharacterized protein n=1 Tax=Xenorhabdus budapestensis TaxID=290110 RepID=A0A2D0J0N3_XENBU|nr:hypothetical protein Xbud_01860 [Xenorhabdus budapestensis]